MAAKLGKPLKVDINTIDGLRGSYARVCVELDLSQPLEVSVAIGRYDYQIEYEHIHMICFSCGRVGHRMESCSSSSAPKKKDNTNQTVANIPSLEPVAVKYNGTLVPEKPEDKGFGDWMLVSRRNTNKYRPNGPNTNGQRKMVRAAQLLLRRDA